MMTPLTLDKMVDLIKRHGRPFVIREQPENDLLIFTYTYAHVDLFKGPDEAFLRECRGLIFNSEGKILSRPYHKFFNLDEHPECRTYNLPRQPHTILQKLDGSMIRPLLLNGEIVFASKSGITECSQQVDRWAVNYPNYIEFCRFMVERNLTPVFEWCSQQQKIVVDYPVDRLVLTTVRCNESGFYWTHQTTKVMAKTFGVEVVEPFEMDLNQDLKRFVEHTRNLKGEEGYVVRWPHSGLMVKLKADEYLELHRVVSMFESEKVIIEIVMDNKVDDFVGKLKSHENLARLKTFEKRFREEIDKKAVELATIVVDEYKSGKTIKEFAQAGFAKHIDQYILFQIWKGLEQTKEKERFMEVAVQRALTEIENVLRFKLSSKIGTVRHLFGNLDWTNFLKGESQ